MMRAGLAWAAACVGTRPRAHGVTTLTHDATMATMKAFRQARLFVFIVRNESFVWAIVIMNAP
jgi:hypothetical protein